MTWSLLVAAAVAQAPGPLPRAAPDVVAGPVPQVHLEVHEDLDPDLLRGLARTGVTVWLETRSNTLRDSTLEHLARFDDAFIRVRTPLKPGDVASLRRVPRAGVWVTDGDLARRPSVGPRRLAVSVLGRLDEARVARIEAVRPVLVRWAPDDEVDLLQWGYFTHLRARRVVALKASQLRSVPCVDRMTSHPVTVEIDAALVLTMNGPVFPCPRVLRVVVPAGVEPWLVQSLSVREPALELVVRVGASEQLARQTRALLETLQRGRMR